MRDCWIHDWEKWETYKANIKFLPKAGMWSYGSPVEAVETRQRRKCLKCGKMQDEKVAEDFS